MSFHKKETEKIELVARPGLVYFLVVVGVGASSCQMEDIHTLWTGSCAKTNFFHVGVMTITSCDSGKKATTKATVFGCLTQQRILSQAFLNTFMVAGVVGHCRFIEF